jgi:hypothetical protein
LIRRRSASRDARAFEIDQARGIESVIQNARDSLLGGDTGSDAADGELDLPFDGRPQHRRAGIDRGVGARSGQVFADDDIEPAKKQDGSENDADAFHGPERFPYG